VVNLRDNLRAKAAESHIPAETFSADVGIEGKNPGGDLVRFYYMVVTVHDGPRTFTYAEHRIESEKQLFEQMEELEKAKITVKK
jgi:hypothetical protein